MQNSDVGWVVLAFSVIFERLGGKKICSPQMSLTGFIRGNRNWPEGIKEANMVLARKTAF